MPDVESYFKGMDKVLRNRELGMDLSTDDERSVKFFITEAAAPK